MARRPVVWGEWAPCMHVVCSDDESVSGGWAQSMPAQGLPRQQHDDAWMVGASLQRAPLQRGEGGNRGSFMMQHMTHPPTHPCRV